MIWAFNASPNKYYLEAMTALELEMAPRDEFIRFVKANGDALFDLTSRILIRLGGLLSRMEYMVFGNAGNKVASIISICAERFGHKNVSGNTVVGVPLTHKDIANLIGVVRETVSIEMKRLENEGIIGYDGRHILIKDSRKLRSKSKLGLE